MSKLQTFAQQTGEVLNSHNCGNLQLGASKLGYARTLMKKQQDETPKTGLICCFVLGAIAPNLHHGATFSINGSNGLINENALECTVKWIK
jgi:hypothetical protein